MGSGGVKEAAKILSGLTAAESEKILETLVKKNPELVELLRQNMVSFEDIQLLTVNMVRDLLKEVAIDDLALALRLGSKALRLHVLDCVSNNVKRDILDVLDGPPKQVTTVQEAQERVMVIVRDKVQKGIFSLNISNDEEYV